MVKICTKCGIEYDGTATMRNRKGMCKDCKNEHARMLWNKKQLLNGKEPFKFYNLLAEGLKRCTKCNNIKDVSSFSKSKTKHGLRATCKDCDSKHYAEYERLNKDRINANRRNRRKCPERGIVFTQRDRQRSLFRNNRQNKKHPATKQIRELLGCSLLECKKHLESLFVDGMTWRNRGIGDGMWQIDHKIPVSLTEIDYENGIIKDTELNRKIWHYTNLQPLWHIENARKSNKILNN